MRHSDTTITIAIALRKSETITVPQKRKSFLTLNQPRIESETSWVATTEIVKYVHIQQKVDLPIKHSKC